MRRILIFAYGLLAYAIGMASLLYLAGWIAGVGVPRPLDGAPSLPWGQALAIDLGLLTLFAVQHSGMARPAFKRRWTRIVPAVAERSTFVLFSGLALIGFFVFWQPIGGSVWSVETPALRALIWGLYGLGWGILVGSTFLLNHFDLFGLRQVWLQLRGRPYTPPEFDMPLLYRYLRHPLYLGMLILLWSAPTMSLIHLIFALGASAYILVAIQLEERDLASAHPEYTDYRRRVPMLIPRRRRAERIAESPAAAD